MKAKTVQSFFPTDAKITPMMKENYIGRYAVMKRIPECKESQVLDREKKTNNIFANTMQRTYYSFESTKEKPVGGWQMFYRESQRQKKDKNARNFRNYQEDKKSGVEFNRNDIGVRSRNSGEEISQRKEKSSSYQQIFKKHSSYEHRPKTKGQTQRPLTSSISAKQQTKYDEWAREKRQQYQSKMGFVNEIFYKRPLQERYGDKYFEYMLRNRFQEDLPPPPYIYQLGEDTEKKVEKNPFISKLRKMHPGLKNRSKFAVKGSQIAKHQE